MSLMPMSFSRLSTFEQCPAKFDHLYVSKTVKDSDNEYTIYGTRVHEALEAYAKAKGAATAALPALDDDVARFAPLVDRILSAPGEKRYEYQMAITADRTPCDWFSRDVWIRGVADVLVIDGVRAWCIDWKTGKPKPNPTQLQLFSALIFAHFPVEEVRTAFVWLNHDDMTETTYKRSHNDHVWTALEPRFAAAQEAVDLGVFKAKPSGLCRYCPARSVCADARS